MPASIGMVHLEYVNSLLEYQKSGIDFTLASFDNESLITAIVFTKQSQPHFARLRA